MKSSRRIRSVYNTPVALRVNPDPVDRSALVLRMYTKVPLPPEEVREYRLFIHNKHRMDRRMRNHRGELTF